MFMIVFFFNDTATTEIYTLSLHDALPISVDKEPFFGTTLPSWLVGVTMNLLMGLLFANLAMTKLEYFEERRARSEEHTSELQSRQYLVCRLLLEKKKKLKQSTYQVYSHRA